MKLKQYTPREFKTRLQEFWDQDIVTEMDPIECFKFFTGGDTLLNHPYYLSDDNQDICTLFQGIIKNPTHTLTIGQLTSIMDEGNHCLSNGSIFQEDNLLIIIWSNKGHI